jgi:hypothetical protein
MSISHDVIGCELVNEENLPRREAEATPFV